MKKFKFLTVISAIALLTGCGPKSEHTFEEDYSYDDIKHWKACTDNGCDEMDQVGLHKFDTPFVENGVEKERCKTCGMTREINHEEDFANITTFVKTIEIHTKEQQNYLKYKGNYEEIPDDAFPSGNVSKSDPVKQTITWEYNEDDENLIRYSISISQNEDMSDAFEIMGTNQPTIDAYNFFLGTNYYRINAYTKNAQGETIKVSSEILSVNVNETCPRNIYVGETMTNCRDTGGRVTEDGKATVKQGMLYRTCGNAYTTSNRVFLDDEGKRILRDELKIKTEINVNDSTTYNFNIPEIKCYDTLCDYNNETSESKHHFARNTESVKNVFALLANEENYPIAYHCRIGTDRTGLIAILVNGVLGVSISDIYQDYLFSNFGNIGTKRYVGPKAGSDNIQDYMDEIRSMPGDTFQEQVYNTLLTIGVTSETIEKVKDILLDGEKTTNENDQIIVTADKMTDLSATSLKREDKSDMVARNNPASYITMNGGASVNVKFKVTRAGERQIYGYIGHEKYVKSLMIDKSLKVELDGKAVTVPSISFADAGLGHCATRTLYYFVKLGSANMTAGEHTITITGLANSINLGNIAIL